MPVPLPSFSEGPDRAAALYDADTRSPSDSLERERSAAGWHYGYQGMPELRESGADRECEVLPALRQ